MDKPFDPVIRPATRVNKADKPEQPNTELMIIKTIQGLISQATKEIGKLSDKRNIRVIKCKAIEEIDSFEKTTLFELQKAFE